MSDWQIQKTSRMCGACGEAIEPETEYYSGLLDTGSEFERRDFCVSCWEQADRSRFFSFWKARYPKPEEKRRLLVDPSVMYDLFRQLDDTDDPSRLGFRYFLALLLSRKRLLKLDSVEHDADGREVLIMEDRRPEKELREAGSFRVVNPGLTPENLEALREELSVVLAMPIDGVE